MINFFKKHVEIIFIFISSLTPLWWLKNNEIIIGHDSGFRLNYLDHLINLFYSWNHIHNFGTDWGILKGFLIIQFPETFFSVIFGSLALGQKATFIFWFFIMGASMYIFLRNFFPKREFWILRIFGSVFYMYNFFLLQGWFIAERAKFSLFAALPLGLLVIYKTLNKEYSLLKGVILFSLLSFFLNGGGSPPLYGSLILVYGLTFVFLTILNIKKNGFREVLFTLKTAILFGLGFLSINAYFILPQMYAAINGYSGILSSIGGISGILAWENAINKYASVLNLIRLQGIPDWYDNPSHTFSYHYINNPVLIILSFTPILLILFGLFFQNRKDLIKKQQDVIHLLFIVLLVGIVFAGGSHPPFGFLYIFLVEHVPGFAIFRSAIYKFGPAVWFSIIVLSSFYINLILSKFIKNKKIFNLVGFGSILLIFIYHFPFFSANFFEFNKPFATRLSIPDYVSESNSYVNNLDSSTKLILIPKLDPLYKVDSYSWGFWSLEPLPFLSLNHPVVSNDTVAPEFTNQIYKSITGGDLEYSLRLLGRAGINKAIFRSDIIYNDKLKMNDAIKSENEKLLNNKNISIEKEFESWQILNISSGYYLPLFYSPISVTSSNATLDKNRDLVSSEDDVRTLTLYHEIENSGKSDVFNKISNDIYIEPECILCLDREYESQRINLLIPKATILPGSVFHKFKKNKENKIKTQVNEPSQKIDVNLAFSQARVSELSGVFSQPHMSSEERELELKNLSLEHNGLISEAISGANSLSGIQNDKYKTKIAAYLYSQKDLLDTLYTNDHGSRNIVLELIKFIDSKISLIEEDAWYSKSLKEKKLVFNIEEKDEYEFRNLSNYQITESYLDGKSIDLLNPVILEKGEHRLEIKLKDESSQVLDQRLDEFSLDNNQAIKLQLKNISEYDKYILTFEYKAPSEVTVETLTDHDNSVNSRINLYSNTNWELISQELKNNSASPSIVNLIVKNISKGKNSVSVRNLKLTKKSSPRIYLHRSSIDAAQEAPSMSFRKINQTHYLVNVKDAKSPFVLNFGSTFNPGWKAYIVNNSSVDEEIQNEYFNGEIKEVIPKNKLFDKTLLLALFGKPISESNHIKANGYSNAWFVDKTGDFKIVVFYEPQKAFYLGGIISIVTFTLFIFILLKLRYGNN